MESEVPAPLRGGALFLAGIGLALATFIDVLDYSIANVSIPYIAGDLAVSNDEGTYVITSFAVGSAIGLPVTGFLARRVGTVRLTIWGILLFTLFSWLCGLSFTLPLLVVNRFFQGLASGPLIPLSQTLITRCFPKEKRVVALAFWSTVVVVAPVLGPMLGGWISYDYYWPWIFYVNIPVGLFSAFVIYHTMKSFETKKEKSPIDWMGLALLAISMSTLQIFLDKGQEWDWWRSPRIQVLATVSLISFVYLIIWEWWHKRPILDLKLLKIRSFSLSLFFIALSYAIYFGGVVLMPLWLQVWMGYTSIWAGWAVAPLGIIPFCFSFSIPHMIQKFGVLTMLAICFTLFSASCFYTAYFYTDVDFWHVALSRLSFGAGMLFFITPLLTLSMQDMPFEHQASGAGIFHFIRALFGGIGTSVFTTLWMRRTYFHHSNLIVNITPLNPMSNSAVQQLTQLGFTQESAMAQLDLAINQQASVLALNDCFWVMAWTFPILLLMLPLGMQRKKVQSC